MLGTNNNPLLSTFDYENQFLYQANASNQLHLFGNLPAGCSLDPVNYVGNGHGCPMFLPNKRRREEAEDFSRQAQPNPQISLNYNTCQDEPMLATNVVSTGLRLSNNDEQNPLPVPPLGTINQAGMVVPPTKNHIKHELQCQKEELDRFIKSQQEQLMRGLKEMTHRHSISFMASIEKCIRKKIQDKEAEIQNICLRNKELVDRVRLVATEAQNWHQKAKYNESVVNALRSNLESVVAQEANRVREGFGDSEADDAVSCIDPAGRGGPALPDRMICKGCRERVVCMLLIPCRHLCLCKECDALFNVCPVCQMVKSASAEVSFS